MTGEKNRKQRLAALPGVRVEFDADMSCHCTLRAGGRAWALVTAEDRPALARVLAFCAREGVPWRMIGRGSNILVRDQGYPGVLIRLGPALKRIEVMKGERIRAGAAVPLPSLLAGARNSGLAGLEFLAGIPGCLGGALRMNAGAFGRAIGERLHTLAVMDGQGGERLFRAGELSPAYRDLGLPEADSLVIVEAVFNLERDRPEHIRRREQEYLGRRQTSQPGDLPSAGSFFKNPPGDYAGRLIEAAGLKGQRLGGAMVSPVHANFIVNTGTATAGDILRLMRLIQEKVLEDTAIFLEPEVHIF